MVVRSDIIQTMDVLFKEKGEFCSTKVAKFQSTNVEELIDGQPFGPIVGLELWTGSCIGRAIVAGISEELRMVKKTGVNGNDVDGFAEKVKERRGIGDFVFYYVSKSTKFRIYTRRKNTCEEIHPYIGRCTLRWRISDIESLFLGGNKILGGWLATSSCGRPPKCHYCHLSYTDKLDDEPGTTSRWCATYGTGKLFVSSIAGVCWK
jgi:hypothetical protein